MRLSFEVTENDIKKLVKKAFDRLTAWSFAPVQHGMGAHGIPDRVACVPIKITSEMVGLTIGVFAAVECKKPGRRGEKLAGHTGAQVTQLRDILTANGVALSCDSDGDVEFLSLVIEQLKAGRDVQPALLQYLKRRIQD